MARRTVWGDITDFGGSPENRRGWALAGQDGIISTAGILLGFVAAGADEATLIVAGQATIVAGMLTAGGAAWSAMAARSEAEVKAIADERNEQRAEGASETTASKALLVSHYVAKGLPPALAAEVADELLIRSPLKSALELEHGIFRLTSGAEVAMSGVSTALAYGLGAAVPLLIAWYVPLRIEIMLVMFSVVVSLIIVSVAGARAGGMNVARTLLRTMMVAAVTIGISYAIGETGTEI